MQRRGQQQSNGARDSRESNNGIGEQIGGPFEAAPWYLHDGAQTVDLYSSHSFKSQLESSGHWNRSAAAAKNKSPLRTPKSPSDLEYTADAPPPADDGENQPPRALEYHRGISEADKMSVSDERFEPPVSQRVSFQETERTPCALSCKLQSAYQRK